MTINPENRPPRDNYQRNTQNDKKNYIFHVVLRHSLNLFHGISIFIQKT